MGNFISTASLSTALQDIFTKFGVEIDMAQPRRALSSNFTFDKIPDGGRRHSENLL